MSDFLFEIGVETSKADSGVQEFIKRTAAALDKLPVLNLKINTGVASNQIKAFADEAKSTLRITNPTITAKFDASAARSSIGALTNDIKNLSKSVDLTQTVSGLKSISGAATSGAVAVRNQGDAFDYLGKTVTYSIMHLVEYMLIMRGLETAAHEVANSLKLAAEVQLEQTLQGLYNKNVDLNQSLNASIIIARQWGSDISDVQQVVGLWTKNTGDLSTAIYLANEAEKLHRASGIDTLEVYRTSIAMTEQLGLKLGQLPTLYNNIAEASLKMALPLKAIGANGSQEGIKQLVEGISESASTLKSMNFVTKEGATDISGIVALVATQLEAADHNGKEVGKNISNMLAALEGAGKNRRNFEDIISGAKDTDEVLDQMIARTKELKQGLADKDFGVKTQQFEALNNLLATLDKVKKLKADLVANSSGKLNLISEAEMSTAIGQFDRLKTSVEIFSLALGQKLLPNAQEFMQVLNGSLLPALTHAIPLILDVATAATRLGAGFLVFQGLTRVVAIWQTFTTALQATILAQQTGISTTAAMAAIQAAAAGDTTALTAAQARLGGVTIATATTTAELSAALLAESSAEADALGFTTRLTAADVALEAATLAAASAAADATGTVLSLGTAEGEAAVAAGGFTTSLYATATGLGAMATGALAAIGPLAAVVAAVGVAMSAMNGLDKQKNFDLGADISFGNPNRLSPEQLLRSAGNSGQIIAANVSGHGNQLNAAAGLYQKDLDTYNRSDQEDPSTYAYKVHHFAEKMQYDTGDAQQQDRDSIKSLLEQQFQSEQNRSYLQTTDFSKLINDAMRSATGLGKKLAPGATGEPPASPLPGSSKGVATPQDVLGTAVKDTKTTASSIISEQSEIQAGYRATAQSLKDLGEVYGYTKKEVKELSDAYDGQIDAEKKMLAAAQAEKTALLRQQTNIEKQAAADKAGGKSKSKAYLADERELAATVAAINRISGAVVQYTADLRLLQVEKDKALGTAKLDADLKGAGLGNNVDDVKHTVAEATKNLNLNSKATGYTDIIAAATSTGVTLDALKAKLEMLLKTAKNPEEIKELKLLLQDVGDASLQASDKVEQAKISLNTLADSIQKIGEGAANKNLDTLGEMLGVDKADLDYVKAIADGMKEIADKRRELITDADQIQNNNSADAQHTRDVLQWTSQQLDLEQKLLVVYEQQKLVREKIQSSELYKATDAAFTKSSTNLLDLGIDKSLNLGKKSNDFTDILATWMKSVLGDGLKGQINKLTDGLFGVPGKVDDAALLKAYHTLVQDKLTNIDKNISTLVSQATTASKPGGADNAPSGPNPFDVPLTSGSPNDPYQSLLNMAPGTGINILDDQGQPLADSIATSTNSDLMLTAMQSTATDMGTVANAVDDSNSSSSPGAAPSSAGGYGSATSNAASAGGFGGGGGGFNIASAVKALGGAAGGGGGGLLGLTGLSSAKGASTIGERNVSSFGTFGALFSAAGAALPKVQGPNGTMVASPISQDLSRVGSGIAGASEAVQGFQTGGLSGGLETGLGIWQTEAAINPALAASPVGIGIAAVGGIVSGLIHHDNEADMPDKYMPGYGQGVANLQGQGFANGVHYQENPQLQQSLGGRTEIQAIEETLAAGRPSWMTQNEYSSLMSMFGSSASGSGKLTVGANLNQEKITGATGTNGQFFTPQQLDSAASQFASLFAQNINKTLAPILQFNISGASAGYLPNVNNLPGATASEQAALRASQYGANSANGTSIIPLVSNATSTPGVGTSAPGTSTTNPIYVRPADGTQAFNVTTTINLDGQQIAQAVNAVNATTANRYGQSAA